MSRAQVLWLSFGSFCLGVLAAFPLAAPLIGTVLPEGAATLWGAALGAGVAVSGSVWVVYLSEKRQCRQAASLVAEILYPVSFALDELRGTYGQPSGPRREDDDNEPDHFSPADWSVVATFALLLVEKVEDVQKRMNRIDGVLGTLSSNSVALSAYFAFESEMGAVKELAEQVADQASAAGVRLYGGPPSWSTRFILGVHSTHLSDSLKGIRLAS